MFMAKVLDNRVEIAVEENCLTLCDEDGNNKGYIQFYEDVDESGYAFTFIEEVESYYSGEGNFSVLFNKLEAISRKKHSGHLLLMVDLNNEHAISIYQHLGFYPLGEEDLSSDRVFMRKDLSFDGE